MKLLKDKSQFHVVEALDDHSSQQKPLSTGVKGVNFYVRNTILRSDQENWTHGTSYDVCS